MAVATVPHCLPGDEVQTTKLIMGISWRDRKLWHAWRIRNVPQPQQMSCLQTGLQNSVCVMGFPRFSTVWCRVDGVLLGCDAITFPATTLPMTLLLQQLFRWKLYFWLHSTKLGQLYELANGKGAASQILNSWHVHVGRSIRTVNPLVPRRNPHYKLTTG